MFYSESARYASAWITYAAHSLWMTAPLGGTASRACHWNKKLWRYKKIKKVPKPIQLVRKLHSEGNWSETLCAKMIYEYRLEKIVVTTKISPSSPFPLLSSYFFFPPSSLTIVLYGFRIWFITLRGTQTEDVWVQSAEENLGL